MTQVSNAKTGVNSLDLERAGMVCSPSQMRIALSRLNLLEQVQAIVDSNPEAKIVWEYATSIRRVSPFISSMKGGMFTDDVIDNLFRTAMQVQI